MTPVEIALMIYAVVLALTSLVVVYRMIVGPTILDRAVSTDSLVVLVLIGMALYSAEAKASWAGPAMLGLTGLAFIGTVTFARFVGREDPLPRGTGAGTGLRREPGTGTGPLDAIHVDPDGSQRMPTLTEPVNVVPGDLPGASLGAAEGGGSFAAHDDRFERGFGAEEGSRGFESEEHSDAAGPGGDEAPAGADDGHDSTDRTGGSR